MKSRIFSTVIVALVALMAAGNMGFAQDVTAKPINPPTDSVSGQAITTETVTSSDGMIVSSPTTITVKTKTLRVKMHELKKQLKSISVNTNTQVLAAVKDLTTEIDDEVKDIAPQINMAFKEGADININTNNNSADDVSLVKSYSKVYPVDANDGLAISNRYGSVVVTTWARNEIKVDVQIKVGAGSQEVAQKLLDNVTISDNKDGNTVNFSTNIGEVKNSWFSMFSGGGNHELEINYKIYMPAKNNLTIDNRYGAIVIPDMDGKISINSAYGSFKGGVLNNQSDIRVKYGNADIQSVGSCAIEVGYGGLDIGSADKIAANISYSGIKIGKLHDSGSINMKYGDGLQIDDLDRTVKSLAVNASYANVNIGLSGDESANFAIVTHYGDFNYDGHEVTITEKTPEDDGRPHFTKSYKGYLGKAGSSKTIAINSNYGNVKFQ